MKYRLSKHIRTLVRLLTLLPVVLLVAGCVNDYDDCPAPETGTEPVKLRFTIVTRTPMGGTRQTRAADIEGEQEGSVSENYLNLAGRDIQFLLFDGNRQLLRDFTPDAGIILAAGDDNRYVTYTVHATIVEPYFAGVANAATDFYIMVIANGRPYGLSAFGFTPGITTIEDITEQLASFTLKDITIDPETLGQLGWEPSDPGIADGEYIPMSGLQKFTLAKGAFDAKGPEDFVELSPEDGSKDINMLRALVKIEVIDKIEAPAGFNHLFVEKVELLGYCATGTILPAYEEWNRNEVLETQQVVHPTMANPIVYRTPLPTTVYTDTKDGTCIQFHEDAAATQSRDDKCAVFSVYTTEYSKERVEAQIQGFVAPYIRVTMKDPDKPDDTSPLYLLRLASYSGGAAGDDLPELLRNHIYRYEIVNVVSDETLNIQYTLCPMGSGETDIPSFE